MVTVIGEFSYIKLCDRDREWKEEKIDKNWNFVLMHSPSRTPWFFYPDNSGNHST